MPGLPATLDGVRVGHLSDFHFGAFLSRGNGAGLAAARWVAERDPDLVCITGDLVSHPRGERRLREALAVLDRPYVVLGNHDVAVTRDPFSRAAELHDLEAAELLADSSATIALRGHQVELVGVAAPTYQGGSARPWQLAGPADLRILLCHFPGIAKLLPEAVFPLTLAGHLHAGQIVVPLPGGRRVTLAHPRARYVAGLYDTAGRGVMHVSPGTGTTFIPFRLFARPEVTELVLRTGGA